MTVTSFRAHSRANGPACACAIAPIVIAKEATRVSAGSRRRSRHLDQTKVLTTIDSLLVMGSIAGSYKGVDRGDDVECEPGARHDDDPAMIVRRRCALPDVALIGFGDVTAVLD